MFSLQLHFYQLTTVIKYLFGIFQTIDIRVLAMYRISNCHVLRWPQVIIKPWGNRSKSPNLRNQNKVLI